MALPRPTRPEYSTTIPSTGKKCRYQPFTVREEKVLILAAEGQDAAEITNAVRNCLKNCITSPQDLDIDNLALFDIEFLFLKCRAKSVGEKIKLKVTDPEDETFTADHEINIDKITVSKNEEHSDLITISDDIQVKMNYPNIEFFEDGVNTRDISGVVNMFQRCLGSIVVGEEVYSRTDMSEDEIVDWIEGLSSSQFQMITKFFQTMPRLKHEITLKNTNTGKNFTVELEGLGDFF